DLFNPERGFHFISYAVWWIRQSIKYAIQQKASLIRLPLNRMADLKRIAEAEQWFENQDDQEASIENIAEYMNMEVSDVNLLLRMSKDHLSLDAPMADSEDFTLGENLADTKEAEPQDSLEFEQLKGELWKSLDQLTEREREVVMLRFGLDGGPIFSLQRIGKMINLSKERVRQIEKKALRKIRTGVNSRQLGAFLS
ncbi:MAG: sigma-70 family RNA polymerase sigma factor, partial [Leptonema sp. (in: Bacteria)]|nr:sigma-70 family RNA polymerase sigma factor [Leptonema sp. (in: bacteria)]